MQVHCISIVPIQRNDHCFEDHHRWSLQLVERVHSENTIASTMITIVATLPTNGTISIGFCDTTHLRFFTSTLVTDLLINPIHEIWLRSMNSNCVSQVPVHLDIQHTKAIENNHVTFWTASDVNLLSWHSPKIQLKVMYLS